MGDQTLMSGQLGDTLKSANNASLVKDHVLTVAIHGAGPVGLFLANSLLATLGPTVVQVIVYENRVDPQNIGRKLPYNRQWLTSLDLELLVATIDPRVASILQNLAFGNGAKVSIPIAMLETLLLLSCRDLGIHFELIGNNATATAAAIDEVMCNVDVAFDATGNRLVAPFAETATRNTSIWLLGSAFQKLGSAPLAPPQIRTDVYPNGAKHYPITKAGLPYALVCTKIIGIPLHLKSRLQSIVDECQWETCGQFYLWSGLLTTDVNSMILLVGLRESEARELRKSVGSLGMSRFANPNGVVLSTLVNSDVLDLTQMEVKFRQVLQFLSHACGDLCKISAPFEINPYIYSPPTRASPRIGAATTCAVTTEWVRVGDSCFVGDPTLSSGLGKHIQIVRQAVEEMKEGLLETKL